MWKTWLEVEASPLHWSKTETAMIFWKLDPPSLLTMSQSTITLRI